MSSHIPPASTTQSRFHRRLRLIASLLAALFAVGSLTIAGGAHLENASQVAEFVVCDDPARQWTPAIDNSVIVWSDTRNGTDDIYGYDLDTRSELAICTAGSAQSEPDVSGDTVVWQDRRNSATGPDIYGYTISNRIEFAICTESHGQASPAIYGNYVVWQDSRAGSNNQDIYGYDLNTRTEFPISTAEKTQVLPAISGTIVVWIDYRHEPNPLSCWPDCNTDIYGYDLSTATEFEICTEGHGQWYPVIDGDTVVWID